MTNPVVITLSVVAGLLIYKGSTLAWQKYKEFRTACMTALALEVRYEAMRDAGHELLDQYGLELEPGRRAEVLNALIDTMSLRDAQSLAAKEARANADKPKTPGSWT
ncbi:hypothetical protein D3C76_1437980 [compost metagenome]